MLALYHVFLMLAAIGAGVASLVFGFYWASKWPGGLRTRYNIPLMLGLAGVVLAYGAVFAFW